MVQPEGFVDTSRPEYVYELKKTLDGLKQASRAWFEKLRSTMKCW